MQLTPIAAQAQPAGLALNPLKPIAARRTVPASRASYRLLLRANHPPPLPTPCNSRRMGHCLAARTKARDEEEETEPEPQAPAKEVEEAVAAAERSRRGEPMPSLAYQIFETVYLCAYVMCCRIGEPVVANAQHALERLRRYVVDKFNRKR
ncbi:unnamed protein product [Urochloa humidicola]